jgi:uncharacterized protein YbjT (DUF2867 family)
MVTGGTGFVGGEIVRQLRDAGHEPVLLRRAAATESIETVAELMRGCNAVIHLVGIISEAGSQTFENIHTRLTEKIVAATKVAGIRRYIHMSALGTRPNAISRYHQSKWAAEECVRRSGLDWTIFRPSIIYGPGDGFVNLFARMSRWSPVMPLIGGGHTKFQPIAVANVARAFVAALAEPGAVGKTLALAGDEVFSFRELVELVLVVTKRRRFKVPIPFGVARFQAALAEFVFAKILRMQPPLSRDQVTMLQEDNVTAERVATDLFGLKHEPFATGIAPYLK